MNADAYFSIGSTHQVCQDYAIANGDFVILSDGCSSAKNSDWGARLLANAAYNILKRTKPLFQDINKFSLNVLQAANSAVERLELHPDCLAATLLCAYKSNGTINAFIIGDGYIIARNKERLTVISHMFDTGAPWYLYYNLNDDLKDAYQDHFGHGKLIVDHKIFEKEKCIYSDEYSYNIQNFRTMPYSFPEEFDLVGVASDGLKTFVQSAKNDTSITNKSVDIDNIIRDLFSFKTLEGQFVHRRCQKFMRDCASKNIKHTDDFSLGVLHHA